jgi:hypothetical protein
MLNIGGLRAPLRLAVLAYTEPQPSKRRFCIIEEAQSPVKRPHNTGNVSAGNRIEPPKLARRDEIFSLIAALPARLFPACASYAGLFRLDRNQFHFKNQRSAGSNVAARAALTIRKVRWNKKLPL